MANEFKVICQVVTHHAHNGLDDNTVNMKCLVREFNVSRALYVNLVCLCENVERCWYDCDGGKYVSSNGQVSAAAGNSFDYAVPSLVREVVVTQAQEQKR